MHFASESCIQELLSASDCKSVGNEDDGWKLLAFDNGVEISKRRSGSFDTFRSRWLLTSVSPEQFITVANAIDAAKACLCPYFLRINFSKFRVVKSDIHSRFTGIRLIEGDRDLRLFF